MYARSLNVAHALAALMRCSLLSLVHLHRQSILLKEHDVQPITGVMVSLRLEAKFAHETDRDDLARQHEAKKLQIGEHSPSRVSFDMGDRILCPDLCFHDGHRFTETHTKPGIELRKHKWTLLYE